MSRGSFQPRLIPSNWAKSGDCTALTINRRQQFSAILINWLYIRRIPGNNDHMTHGETGERPWGTYLVLDDEPEFKVKRIVVEAGKRLSYQWHQHRSEHWFIVNGDAIVTLNDVTHKLSAGEAIDVPRGAKHRIENPGPNVLIFVEVQHGDYFGEDDIIRIEDDFGRTDG